MTVTVSDAWENFLATKTLKANTQKIDTYRWHTHLKPYWSNVALDTIKTRDILAFKQQLMGTHLSPQSVLLCLSQLRRILRRAMQLELYSGPIPHFEMPKFDNKRIRFLKSQEANTLLQVLEERSPLWCDVAGFALSTGLRAGEIFSLQPSCADVENKLITVFDTKNYSSRSVPLNCRAVEIVKKRMSLCKTENLSYLFCYSERPNKKIEQVGKIFKLSVESCKLNEKITDRRQRVVFHTLRHNFASWLVQSGTPLMVVGQLLGHKTLAMTLRYSHLSPEQGRSAVEKLPNLYNFGK